MNTQKDDFLVTLFVSYAILTTLFSFILRNDSDSTFSCIIFFTYVLSVACCLVLVMFGSEFERALGAIFCVVTIVSKWRVGSVGV